MKGLILNDNKSEDKAFAEKVKSIIHSWERGDQWFSIRTSGSTGKPKKWQFSRQSLIQSARLTGQTFELRPGDTAMLCMDTAYVAGFMMVIRALVLDLKLVVTRPVANPLSNISSDMAVDFIAVVPIQLQTMIVGGSSSIVKLNRMKAVLVGGAPVERALEKLVQQIHVPVYQTYGMTETLTHVAIRRLNGSLHGDFYQPLNGVKTSLDERGCLVLETPVLPGQEFITNDLVKLKSDGSFRWLGRYDNVINSGGFKIQAEKVEDAALEVLSGWQHQAEVLAIPSPNPKLGQKLILLIKTENLSQEKLDSLQQNLKEKLHPYEVPKEIRVVKNFIYTASGKVARKETANSIIRN